MKAIFFSFTCAGVGLLLLGCGMSQDRESAVEQASQFYAALQADNLDGAVGFLAPEFFELTPEAEFRQMIPEVGRHEGPIESFRLTGWHVSNSLNSEVGSGTYVTLQFMVVYRRREATETLLLYRDSEEQDFKIIGYTLDSEDAVRAKI